MFVVCTCTFMHAVIRVDDQSIKSHIFMQSFFKIIDVEAYLFLKSSYPHFAARRHHILA